MNAKLLCWIFMYFPFKRYAAPWPVRAAAQAYMLVADDDVREWGTRNWEEKSADYAAKGFIPISMKNDFSRIYPDEKTKAEQQYVPAELEDEEEELAPAA